VRHAIAIHKYTFHASSYLYANQRFKSNDARLLRDALAEFPGFSGNNCLIQQHNNDGSRSGLHIACRGYRAAAIAYPSSARNILNLCY
jgi:hypothetical protein